MDSPKLERNELNLQDKMKVIEMSTTQTMSQRKVAKHLGVSKSQVQRILKKSKEIKTQYGSNGSSKRKRIHPKMKYGDINRATLQWFALARSKNVPISGKLIQNKAKIIAETMNMLDFSASNGWLQKFCSRHSISLSTLYEDNVSESQRQIKMESSSPICHGPDDWEYDFIRNLNYNGGQSNEDDEQENNDQVGIKMGIPSLSPRGSHNTLVKIEQLQSTLRREINPNNGKLIDSKISDYFMNTYISEFSLILNPCKY